MGTPERMRNIQALSRDLDVLRAINKDRATLLAIGALVAEPGTIRVGDELTVR